MNSLATAPRRALTPVLAAALLAIPATDAVAASKPKVSLGAKTVQASPSGSIAVGVKNASAFKVSGKITAKAGKAKAGSKSYAAKAKSTKTVKVKLSRKAQATLASKRKLSLKVTITAKGGGKARTVKTSVKVRAFEQSAPKGATKVQAPSGGYKPAPIGGGGKPTQGGGTSNPGGGGGSQNPGGENPGGNGGGGSQNPPPVNDLHWVGRVGSGTAYDDFAFDLSGGKIDITQLPLVNVICSENGGSYRSRQAYEAFRITGHWTLGSSDEYGEYDVASPNELAGTSPHRLTYRLTSQRNGNVISGTLKISFAFTNYDYFNNRIIPVNCSGTQSYQAIPAS